MPARLKSNELSKQFRKIIDEMNIEKLLLAKDYIIKKIQSNKDEQIKMLKEQLKELENL